MLRIELVKSPIGHTPRNRATVKALGLRKMHNVVEHEDTPTIRGMIHHVKHLLLVTEHEGEPKRKQSPHMRPLKRDERPEAPVRKKVQPKAAAPTPVKEEKKVEPKKVAAKPAAEKAAATKAAKPKVEAKPAAAKPKAAAKPAAKKSEKK